MSMGGEGGEGYLNKRGMKCEEVMWSRGLRMINQLLYPLSIILPFRGEGALRRKTVAWSFKGLRIHCMVRNKCESNQGNGANCYM